MMAMKILKIICVAALFLGATTENLFAAASFSLRPSKQEVVLSRGEVANRNIFLKNILGIDSVFSLAVKRISPFQNDANIFFEDLIFLSEHEIKLKNGEEAAIPFTLRIPADAPAGGYYGYILVSAKPAGTGEARAASALGALVFVRVDGPVKEEGRLVSFGSLGSIVFSRQPKLQYSFENSGDIFLNPYGKLILTHRLFGNSEMIDLPPRSVLPAKTKIREVILPSLWLPGPYMANLFLNRGYNDEIDAAAFKFWRLPWQFLALVAFVAILTILAFYLFKKRRP